MRVLALDSSGLTASVALVEDDTPIGEYSTNFHKTHSTTLLPMTDELFRMLGMDIAEAKLDAIAIAKGPGSFTGLRIGSATAKGLALALGLPVIPVSTIEGLAFNLWGSEGIVCPVMDARRGQTYTGLYKMNGFEGGMECILEPCAVDISEILEKINEQSLPVTFLGDGVPVFSDRINENCKVHYRFAPASMNRQRAASIGCVAVSMAENDPSVMMDSDDFAPDYLRLSQAERERLERGDEK